MADQPMLTILFRWLHIMAAALVIGGAFFIRIILPAGLGALEPATRQDVLLRCRRGFKMLIHTCILLLLASGVYNSILLFPKYSARPGLLHALWGIHLTLALAVFAISLWLLTGREPPRSHRKWLMLNLLLLAALVAVASTLKWSRESAQRQPLAAAPAWP